LLSLALLLLPLLQLLFLLYVLLLRLLDLPLLSALSLLLPAIIGGVLLQLLLFLLMVLLDALALLALLLVETIQLLLVFLLQRGIDVSGVGRFHRRRTVRVGVSVGRRCIPRPVSFPGVFGRTIRTGGSARFHCGMAVELAGPLAGRNVWAAMVHGSQ
jgi:hypothetical protein